MNKLRTWKKCNFHIGLQSFGGFELDFLDFPNLKIILMRNNIFINYIPVLSFFGSNVTEPSGEMQFAEKSIMNWRNFKLILMPAGTWISMHSEILLSSTILCRTPCARNYLQFVGSMWKVSKRGNIQTKLSFCRAALDFIHSWLS